MAGSRNLRIAVMAAGALLLVGCAGSAPVLTGGGGTTVSASGGGTLPPPPSPPPRITYPSVFVTDYDTRPPTVVVLDSAGTTVSRFQGLMPAVDGAGNIYVLSCYIGYENCTSSNINIYSPDPFQIVRSLPVGPGTKIPRVYVMTVSAAGEIFVNDGSGISVFSPTANGDVDPVRRIFGQFYAYPATMTV